MLQIRDMCRASSSILQWKHTCFLNLSNTVVLLEFPLREARLAFLDVIFCILIFFNEVIHKSERYWVLAQVRTAPTIGKSEKILMSLNGKQKSLCQMATTELYPKETENKETARNWQKHVWVWWIRLVVLSLYNNSDPYFLAWWSLTAQEKGLFQDSIELKTELKDRSIAG